MYAPILKYFAIIYSSRYINYKIQNLHLSRIQHFANALFSFLLSIATFYIRRKIPYISFLLIVLFSIIYSLIFFKQSTYSTIISNIISVGMSNVLNFFVLLIGSILNVLLTYYVSIYKENNYIYYTLILIAQVFFITILFKIPRFKNGIPFLNNAKLCRIGIIISLFSIFASSYFTQKTQVNFETLLFLLLVPLSGIVIIIWWRNRISEKYIKEVRKRTFELLNHELEEKENRISYLTKENNELSAIIHKDNKLIPAMELAVTELFHFAYSNHKIKQNSAEEILTRLKTMSKERNGIIKTYEQENQTIVKTNILTIDSLLLYMSKKAKECNVTYEIKATGNFTFIKDDMDFETDLLTILADLIENALIATKSSDKKNIAIHFTNADYFSVEIFDGGIFFNEEVIRNLGIKRTTSHKNEGGSGIGLMTLISLSQKHKVTLIIEEFRNNPLYIKKISLLFNKETSVIIRTYQENLLSIKSKRPDIQFENLLESST